MKILGIETSCDETAAAVVEDGSRILSNVIVSQIDIFAEYGGVIPEVAARSHLEAILPVIHKALRDADLDWSELDAIAVTHTPGLMGSLLIGTLTARTFAILKNRPLYAVHHLKSHIYANWLEDNQSKTTTTLSKDLSHINHQEPSTATVSQPTPTTQPQPTFPLLALVISGGHTQIIYMKQHNHFEIIGTTRDDAVGECFDKVAKILGLPYPGGPAIDTCAKKGNKHRYPLPHPKVDRLDFSFSGLKTAVLRAVQAELGLSIKTPSYELKNYLSPEQQTDFAASFEETACNILIEKLQTALIDRPDIKSIVLAGGVSANQILRQKALDAFSKDYQVFFPAPKFSGDNGAMVAAAAYFEIINNVPITDPYSLSITPRTPIK